MKTIIFCYFMFLLTNAYAQTPFQQDVFPPPGDASFIYHPRSNALLMIGSVPVIPDSIKNDVWKWDGAKWTKIEAPGPGSRDFFPSGLDTKNGLIYAFGGIGSDQISRGDLWSFDGKQWSKVITNDIGPRDHHKIVYADHLNAFVLYGGVNKDQHPDTLTWLLKDGQFTPLHIAGPGFRYHTGMAYDKNRKKVVLYGGGEHPDELWEFDGIKWTKIETNENPGKKFYHPMVYDENMKMVILHGGWKNQNPKDSANNATPVTWGWDGKKWTKIAEERMFPLTLGYDPKRKTIIGYGRTDNFPNSNLGMWELKDGKWTKLIDYGKWNKADYIKNRVQQDPDDMKALLAYADILQWQTKQFAEAEVAYKKLEIAYPEKTNLLINLAIVLAMQNKTGEVDKYLAKINAAGLLNKGVYARLGGLLQNERKFRESIRYIEKAIEMQPQGNDFYNLARAYTFINETDKAFFNLNKAIEYGFNSKERFERDNVFQSLQNDSRWQELVIKLK